MPKITNSEQNSTLPTVQANNQNNRSGNNYTGVDPCNNNIDPVSQNIYEAIENGSLKQLDYGFALMPSKEMPLERGTLYVRMLTNTLEYTVIRLKGEKVTGRIEEQDLKTIFGEEFTQFTKNFDLKTLGLYLHYLQEILDITSKRGHTLPPTSDILKKCLEGNLHVNDAFISIASRSNRSEIFLKYFYGRVKFFHFWKWKNTSGYTQLQWASACGQLSAVQKLTAKSTQHIDSTDTGERKITPLGFAALYGHLPVVEHLISKGANINIGDTKSNETPLLMAIKQGNTQMALYLMQKGADPYLFNNDGICAARLILEKMPNPEYQFLFNILIKKSEELKEPEKLENSENLFDSIPLDVIVHHLAIYLEFGYLNSLSAMLGKQRYYEARNNSIYMTFLIKTIFQTKYPNQYYGYLTRIKPEENKNLGYDDYKKEYIDVKMDVKPEIMAKQKNYFKISEQFDVHFKYLYRYILRCAIENNMDKLKKIKLTESEISFILKNPKLLYDGLISYCSSRKRVDFLKYFWDSAYAIFFSTSEEIAMQTKLELASAFGQLEVVQKLIQKNPECVKLTENNANFSAPNLALRFGHLAVVELLRSKGAEFKKLSVKVALEESYFEAILWLLEKEAEIDNDDIKKILELGHMPLIKHLFEKRKVSVNKNDLYDSNTPLHILSMKGNLEAVEYLLNQGATVEALNKGGEKPIFKAFRSNNPAVVDLLLKNEAKLEDVVERTPHPLPSPFLEALFVEKYKQADYLLNHHNQSLNEKHNHYGSVFDVAIYHIASLDAVKFLLGHNANLNMPGKSITPSFRVKSSGNIHKDFELKDPKPLHAAASNQYNENDLEIIKELLIHGADVNTTDAHDNTPLHVVRGLSRAKLLLENGANPTLPNKYGDTPLSLAQRRGGYKKIVRYMQLWNKESPAEYRIAEFIRINTSSFANFKSFVSGLLFTETPEETLISNLKKAMKSNDPESLFTVINDYLKSQGKKLTDEKKQAIETAIGIRKNPTLISNLSNRN